MTKFVMLALVAFSLAACETATKDDVALRSDVGPTASSHMSVVRGPVVPDRVEPASPSVAAPRVARVVPNPLSQRATAGSSAASHARAPQAAHARAPQAEPAQPATTATEEALPSDAAPAPLADTVLMQDNLRSAETRSSAPIEFLPKDLTPQKIEAMFGGMPFLLIAAIAAALVASLGLALRRPQRARDEYIGPRGDNVDHLDNHREPFAA